MAKMTEEQIIKALECLAGEMIPCKDCPYSVNYTHFDCKRQAAKDALDLINRQKAEIVMWKEKARAAFLINLNEEEKAEAVKFLFNRLIDISVCKDNGDGTESLYVSIPKARQRLNEMVGDTYV